MVPAKPEYDPDNPNSPAREAVETVQQLLWQVGTVDYETRSNLRDMARLNIYETQRRAVGLPPAFIDDDDAMSTPINNSDVVDLLCWRQCHARPIKTRAVNVIGGGDGTL
jgi:hypothetical protein